MTNYSTGWVTEAPALDYDSTSIQVVLDEVKELQQQFKLGDAHVYKSSENSYHVYFFHDSNRDREQTLEIIKKAEHVDPEFQKFQEKRNTTRMRVQGKHDQEISLETIIQSPFKGQGHPQKAEHLKRTFKRMKKQ